MGIETTGQWGACETCFQAKAKRHAVPKKTDERASVKGQRFFVDVSGLMKDSSLGGNSYVVIFVDDYTRFKVVKFVKKKSNTTVAADLRLHNRFIYVGVEISICALLTGERN